MRERGWWGTSKKRKKTMTTKMTTMMQLSKRRRPMVGSSGSGWDAGPQRSRKVEFNLWTHGTQ